MKNIAFVGSMVMATALIIAAGCVSKRPQAAAQPAEPVAGAGARHAETPATKPVPRAEEQVVLPPGAAKPPAPFEGSGWDDMLDGQSLKGWRETAFAGHGEVHCQSGVIVLGMGDPFTGINWTNEFPKMNYEVALDAMRLTGSDFFCGLTVPVGTNFCSLIVGGWGGSLVGISSLDGMDASENETTKFMSFDTGRWYRLRLRVTEKRITAWIDEDKLMDVETEGKRVSVRPGDIELSEPFGLAAWQTSSAYREIKFRRVP